MQIFSKELNRAGNYRVPSIVTTKNGVVVACCDERWYGGGDNPNLIGKVVRRSFDSGKTWQDVIVVKEEVGKAKMTSSSSIDACMLYDEETNGIFMIYTHTPAGVGILASSKGIGETKEGYRLVYDGKKEGYVKDGEVIMDGEVVAKVDEKGNVTCGEENLGNIYERDGKYKEKNTFFLYIQSSFDDGATWSEPVCLNNQVKEKYMSFIGAGPGTGIVIKNGKYKGRYIFPIYYNTAGGRILMLSNAVIYSDDQGKTWHRGKSPNDKRKVLFYKVNEKFVMPNDMITESQVIELPNSDLKIFMRNHNPKRRILTAISCDGGESWQDVKYQEQLTHCICQCSVINVKDEKGEATVFLNAADTKARKNGVVRLSYDYGETFPYSRVLTEGEFVYSSMTMMPNGEIGVLYEGSTMHEAIEFTTITTKWIKGEE